MKKAIKRTSDLKPILLGCLEKIKNTHKYFDDCSKHDTFIDFPPNATLHYREAIIRMGGYNPEEYPMADTFFFCRAYSYGKIFIIQKCLQYKRSEISEYFQPKTLLAYCFIGSAFILKYYQPKWYRKHQAYCYIQSYRSLLDKYPTILSFIDAKLLKRYEFSKPSFFDKILRKIVFYISKIYRI